MWDATPALANFELLIWSLPQIAGLLASRFPVSSSCWSKRSLDAWSEGCAGLSVLADQLRFLPLADSPKSWSRSTGGRVEIAGRGVGL